MTLACTTSKSLVNEEFFNVIWELEYLSGPKIPFEKLFEQRRPQITFNNSSKMVEGNSGCNGYRASYNIVGQQISFGEPGPTTRMYCGEGESFFLNIIQKIDHYEFDNEGKLNLVTDDVPLMRFKKVTRS